MLHSQHDIMTNLEGASGDYRAPTMYTAYIHIINHTQSKLHSTRKVLPERKKKNRVHHIHPHQNIQSIRNSARNSNKETQQTNRILTYLQPRPLEPRFALGEVVSFDETKNISTYPRAHRLHDDGIESRALAEQTHVVRVLADAAQKAPIWYM
jgi:hypothetical protein